MILTIRFIFYLRCIFLLTFLKKNPRTTINLLEKVIKVYERVSDGVLNEPLTWSNINKIIY